MNNFPKYDDDDKDIEAITKITEIADEYFEEDLIDTEHIQDEINQFKHKLRDIQYHPLQNFEHQLTWNISIAIIEEETLLNHIYQLHYDNIRCAVLFFFNSHSGTNQHKQDSHDNENTQNIPESIDIENAFVAVDHVVFELFPHPEVKRVFANYIPSSEVCVIIIFDYKHYTICTSNIYPDPESIFQQLHHD